ncbi:MAG TPA: hypothetical protein PLR59_07495, partial [Brevundimonas sp.]|nr:hypothetical protein [Brevundimonas sp.]
KAREYLMISIFSQAEANCDQAFHQQHLPRNGLPTRGRFACSITPNARVVTTPATNPFRIWRRLKSEGIE